MSLIPEVAGRQESGEKNFAKLLEKLCRDRTAWKEGPPQSLSADRGLGFRI